MASTLSLRQGVDTGYVWSLVDANGDPADLDGYTAKCQVRQYEAPDATLLTELDAFIDDDKVGIRWTAADSLDWDWARGYSDVLLIDPDGIERQYVWQGMVTVDKAVTVSA